MEKRKLTRKGQKGELIALSMQKQSKISRNQFSEALLFSPASVLGTRFILILTPPFFLLIDRLIL